MRERIRQILEERAKRASEAGQILERARAEKRDMTAEETANFDKAHQDCARLRADADRLERQAALEASIDENLGRRTAPESAGGAGTSEERAKAEGAKRLAAFGSFLRVGIREMESEQRDMVAGTAASGGYITVPQEFLAVLLKGLDDAVWIRQLASKYKVTSADGLGVPTLETDVSDAEWTAEADTITADTSVAFGKREIKPTQLSKLVKVSRKLIRSSAIDVVAFVAGRLAYKFSVAEEKGFLTGNGTAQPLGVFTASADGIPTGRDVSTGNTATAITHDGLLAAKYSLKAQYWRGANWLASRDFVAKCAKLKDNDGKPLLALSDTPGMPDTLLSWPLRVSEFAPNTFTASQYVAVLGDFSYYWIADALSMELQRLDELFAANSKVGFIGRAEVDGQPVLGEAFARVKLAAS